MMPLKLFLRDFAASRYRPERRRSIVRSDSLRMAGFRIAAATFVASFASAFVASPASAATITVTGTGDAIAVDGAVTLREAITSINNGANVNADVVAVGTYGSS